MLPAKQATPRRLQRRGWSTSASKRDIRGGTRSREQPNCRVCGLLPYYQRTKQILSLRKIFFYFCYTRCAFFKGRVVLFFPYFLDTDLFKGRVLFLVVSLCISAKQQGKAGRLMSSSLLIDFCFIALTFWCIFNLREDVKVNTAKRWVSWSNETLCFGNKGIRCRSKVRVLSLE